MYGKTSCLLVILAIGVLRYVDQAHGVVPAKEDIERVLRSACAARDQQMAADKMAAENQQHKQYRGAFHSINKFNKYSSNTTDISRQGFVFRFVQTELCCSFRFDCSGDEISNHLNDADNDHFQCPYEAPYCDAQAKYRTIDGTCNNLNNPLYGAANTPMTRFLTPEYEDGVSTMKTKGGALPNPRLVSSTVTLPGVIPDNVHVNMVMQWGQFVDHDITLTPVTELATDDGNVEISCGDEGCDCNFHNACAPIDIPEGENFFRGQECLPFVRSQQVPNLNCTTGPMSLLNAITAYLDGSAVYGSSLELMTRLRDKNANRGKMAVHQRNGDDLLPNEEPSACEGALSKRPCFLAGDSRANIQSCLASMHTLWVREHNRIEGQLYALHPEWSGEVLFQESRKIIGALLQRITYNEFLPVILGSTKMDELGIATLSTNYSYAYNDTIDASIRQGFASAAYRFGHSLIPDTLQRRDDSYQHNPSLDLVLSNVFFNPDAVYNTGAKGIDGMLRGLISQEMPYSDLLYTKEMTQHLLAENPPHGPGHDIVAINIQRGRDHGLPGYLSYRRYCGLPTAEKFEDLHNITSEIQEKMSNIYSDVEHIDLFIAGNSEDKVEGSIIGPTWSCLLGEQFKLMKNGDRFWHENEGVFTEAQLQEIRKVKLSRVICDNSGVKRVTANAFKKIDSTSNPLMDCTELPAMDITAWS